MIRFAPSIMCADVLNLRNDIEALDKCNVDLFHIDIMDRHFVPNISLNLEHIKAIKKISQTPIDVHLMVDNPEEYIWDLKSLNVEYISFHIEAVKFPLRIIKLIKSYGIRVGVAINPCTNIDALKYIIDKIDYVLIMSVEPGFASQKFIEDMFTKIKDLKQHIIQKNLNTLIEVDGNINIYTGVESVKNGADILVLGTASIFKQDKELYQACIEFINDINKLHFTFV